MSKYKRQSRAVGEHRVVVHCPKSFVITDSDDEAVVINRDDATSIWPLLKQFAETGEIEEPKQ